MKNKTVALIDPENSLTELLDAMQQMGNPLGQLKEIMDDVPAILAPETAQEEMTGRVRSHQAKNIESGLMGMSNICHRIQYMDEINVFIEADQKERNIIIETYINAGDENARYEMELIKEYLIEKELNDLAQEMQLGIDKVIVKLTKVNIEKILSAEVSDRLDAIIFFKRYPKKIAVPTLQVRQVKLQEEIMNKEIEIEESDSEFSMFSLDSMEYELLKEELTNFQKAIDSCENSY